MLVQLEVAGHHFHCMVGVAPQLDCPVFLGRRYLVLAQVLRAHTVKPVKRKVEARDVFLNVEPGDLLRW